MTDISNFIYKETDDSDVFYADFENYETGTVNTLEYEDGDMVLWVWEGKKYRGVLRQRGNPVDGLFELVSVKERA
jgi:hypothetical protein